MVDVTSVSLDAHVAVLGLPKENTCHLSLLIHLRIPFMESSTAFMSSQDQLLILSEYSE